MNSGSAGVRMGSFDSIQQRELRSKPTGISVSEVIIKHLYLNTKALVNQNFGWGQILIL
jgi:hypothetical protein